MPEPEASSTPAPYEVAIRFHVAQAMRSFEACNVKPLVLFLVAGEDSIIYSCRDKLMVRPHDEDAHQWITYTLQKLGSIS